MTSCCCAPKAPLPPPPPSPPASPSSPPHKSWPLAKILETVSTIALCIFAAYISLSSFVLSVAAGAIYQVIKMAYHIKQEGLGTQRPGCGQGFGELISQLKLLAPEIILATAYVAWRHLMHDPKGFVPFVGFFVGMGLAYRAFCYVRKPDCCSLSKTQPV